MKDQLDETQALSWRMEQYMAESRNVLTSCVRLKSELQYDYFTELVLEAAKTSEKLTDKLRRLTLEVTVNPVQYENYKAELVTIHGIEVEFSEGILKVALPLLVPHRKDFYTDFLYKPLHTALQNWCLERVKKALEIPFFEECLVCFVHVYNKNLPLVGRVRDHDNIEEKHVLDIVSSFCMKSDSGFYVDTFHTTRLGMEDGTLLYVMEAKKFPGWIRENSQLLDIEKEAL
ncbi:hypothetical protein G5B24_17880 [Blautia glucerasea]|nr:hypothetical protein [Blautia faecis]NSD39997.1 hypothetical protein [Blautia glucerasea]RHS98916.1 hypothetical protein DW904_11215 [Ruminococcus sp. AM42-11]